MLKIWVQLKKMLREKKQTHFEQQLQQSTNTFWTESTAHSHENQKKCGRLGHV